MGKVNELAWEDEIGGGEQTKDILENIKETVYL